MSNTDINTLDDLMKVLELIYRYADISSSGYNYEQKHLYIKFGVCYSNEKVIFNDISRLAEFNAMCHVTSNSFYDFDKQDMEMSEKIIEVQLCASAFLLDETYKPLKKAVDKLNKIGYKIFKTDLPEFGEFVLQNNKFRIYFDI